MEERRREFVNALSNNTAYGYMADRYYEFTKEELKDIVLECLYAMSRQDYPIPQMIGVKFELMERWELD